MQLLFGLVKSNDPSYSIGFVTSAIENNLALITASVPALTPLLRSWFPGLFMPRDSEASTGGGKPLQNLDNLIELRSTAPRASEEEQMTYDGIVRKGNYEVGRAY